MTAKEDLCAALASCVLFACGSGDSVAFDSSVGPPAPDAGEGFDAADDSGDAGEGFDAADDSGIVTDPCSAFPLLVPGFKPDVSNVGVPASIELTDSGTIEVSTPNTVIDSMNVHGVILVHANNVTIINSKVEVDGYFGIQPDEDVTGLKILRSEVYTTSGGYTGIIGGNFTACGNYVHGFENPFTVGSNVVIQANLIEKLKGDSADAHHDGIEVYSGSNAKIWGNNIRMTDEADNWLGETGAVNVTGTWSVVDDCEIHGNWVGGGSYTLNLDDGQGYAVTNLSITDNTFYGTAPTGYAVWGPVRDWSIPSVFSGNVWEDGNAVTP